MEEMTKEQQYMISMIALAGLSGALIIAFIIACCCCLRYQRKLQGGGSRTRFGKHNVREVQWPVTTTETWGATPYGCTDPYNSGNDCQRNSAYDWALPQTRNVACNPYAMSPRSQVRCGNNDYGRVLLNPPNAVCSKPSMPSTKLAGQCGTGGGCDGKFYQSTGQPVASTTAQFVLDSGATRHYC